MKAMVLAAGLGKRLRPITDHIPKPLVPVHGKVLIDYALDHLRDAGIREIVVNSSYKAEMLEAHLRKRRDVTIAVSYEIEPLETGGGIAKALAMLGAEPFIAMNSDTICVDGTEPALQRLMKLWDDEHMDVLMLLHPREKAIGFSGAGDFDMGVDGRIRRRQGEHAPYIFTGVQMLHPRLFAHCAAGAFSMNVLYDRLRGADGYYSRIGTLVHDGDWLHVGDAAGLAEAEVYFSQI